MLKSLIILTALFSASLSAEQLLTPNPEVTTGDYCTRKDPDFVDLRYPEKIAYCVRNVSYETRQKIYDDYGVPRKCRKYYTIDHFVPLSMGGSNQEHNLWPEHRHVKATRQNLEVELYNLLRDGEITRRQAVVRIMEAKMNPPSVEPWKCN